MKKKTPNMSPEAAALLLSISLGLHRVLSWMKTQTTSCSDWPLRWPLFRFKIICTEMTVFCQSFYYRQGGSLYKGDNIPLQQYSEISKNFMLQELGFAVCKTELWIITRVTHKPVSSASESLPSPSTGLWNGSTAVTTKPNCRANRFRRPLKVKAEKEFAWINV